MLVIQNMTGGDAKLRAERAARKVMDLLIERLLAYKDKKSLKNSHIEDVFGLANAHVRYILKKERCYNDPSLTTVLQLIYGMGMGFDDVLKILEAINIRPPANNIITLPDSFKLLKEREKKFLLNIINDFCTSHSLPERHIKLTQNED